MSNISKGEQQKINCPTELIGHGNNDETKQNNLKCVHHDKLMDKWVKVRVGTNWTGVVEMNQIADQLIKAMNGLIGLFV